MNVVSRLVSPRGAALCAGALLLAAVAAAQSGTAASWPPITDSPTNTHVPGRWVWAELFTEDARAAQVFYQQVFGWSFQTLEAGDRAYALASVQGEPVGGLLQRRHTYSKERGSRWLGMISVPDVKAAARYAEAHGGKVVVPPRDLPGRGEVALLADPEGAPFGVIRSATGDPPDYRGDHNQWIWVELWAKDPAAMAEFYGGLAGYERNVERLPDGKAAYGLASGGYARCRIIPSPAVGQPSAWIPYLRVSDVKVAADAITGAAGRVIVAPDPKVRDGSVALVIDPTGAALGLAQVLEGDTP